jgi:dipeptidyl aminopeptidase/acylaminoacyl peptidase
MAADGLRRLASDDLYTFKLVSEPQFAPDGTRVAYVVTTIERDKNDYRSSIYVTAVDGNDTRRMTRADAKDSLPRWSPDGKHLAFLSNRSEKGQIWLIRADGGEAWQVSELPEGVSTFGWSPDGQSFVAVSKSVEGQADQEDEQAQSDVKHITRTRYRFDGIGYYDDKQQHLWSVPAFGGAPRQLTNADVNDNEPIWSPNGHDIAFVTNRTEGREQNWASEVWAVVANGSGERRMIGGDEAAFHAPSWSPDGSQLAVLGSWHAGAYGAYDSHLWIVPAAGGEPINLTDGFGRSITDSTNSDLFASSEVRPVWTPDGKTILVIVGDAGSTHVHAVSVESGDVRRVTSGKRRVSAVSMSPNGKRIAYVAATMTNPGDVFVADLDGGNETQITALNRDVLSGIALTEPEEFHVRSLADDTEIHGWVLRPPGFDPTRKYPMILQIHGGPHTMYGEAFMHEFHLMAARGYVVLFTNPRGSTGYSEEFTRATLMGWGEKDMPDLMAAVDWAIQQGYVDENRLGVTGGSYGGYMTNWVIGHTDRFRAAVTQRCLSNLHSFYGTSDIGYGLSEYQFGGTAWEKRDLYMRLSPITYVEHMKTPLLILQQEADYRTPMEQAEQLFIALKKLGREVEFVRVPDADHNLSRTGKPKHRVERLEHIIGWFDRHL